MLHPRIKKCKSLVENEKGYTLLIIDLLVEIEEHKDYLAMGYSSLFDFVTKYLGYEEGPALRRISAARITAEIPEARSWIEEGSLGLSQIAKAETTFRKEKRRCGKKLEVKQKLEILESLKGKSYRESEKVLARSFPEVQEKAMTSLQITEELQVKLEKVRSLMSHQDPGMSFEDLISKLCDQAIKKYEPKKLNTGEGDTGDVTGTSTKNELSISNIDGARLKIEIPKSDAMGANTKSEKSTVNVNGVPKRKRYIPAHIKSQVFHRDQGKCTFTSKSGLRCISKHLLQYDHIQPFEHQGEHSAENLRLLCHAHHRFLS